jgi:hypothetical protein
MVRLLYVLGALAMVAAGVILALGADQWYRSDDGATPRSAQSGGLTRLAPPGGQTATGEQMVSPLIAAAQTLASHLNPPAPVKKEPKVEESPKPEAPTVRPPTAMPKFKVRGTSFCVDRPQRSMALIWEPAAQDGGRWVKEGAQIGHFVIHEIQAGSVVYLDGQQLCEMAVEREAVPAGVVADGGRPATITPQATVSHTRPVPPVKRPSVRSGIVGSARTAALD